MGLITVHKNCFLCGKPNDISVDADAYIEYSFSGNVGIFNDINIQEGIISGSHGECFDELADDLEELLPVTTDIRQQYQVDLSQHNDPQDYLPVEDGNLYSSRLKDSKDEFAPVLDLDIPHTYVPSTTEGHGHLYLNIRLSQKEEAELLEVLARLGIVQEFYAQKCVERGFTAVRKPGVIKTEAEYHVSSAG